MRNTSTEYMMYMMSDNVFENPSFHPSTITPEAGVFKKLLAPGTVLENLRFWYPKTPFIRFCWKTKIFLLRFGLPSTRIRCKRSPITHLSKTLSTVEIFLKRRFAVLV